MTVWQRGNGEKRDAESAAAIFAPVPEPVPVPEPEPKRDGGSATPVVLAVLAMIAIFGIAAVDGGAVMVANARTDSVADLTALAAARVDRDSRAEGASSDSALHAGCDVASQVAAVNGATVVSCLRGQWASVRVTVEMRLRAWPLPLRASARAGPSWR